MADNKICRNRSMIHRHDSVSLNSAIFCHLLHLRIPLSSIPGVIKGKMPSKYQLEAKLTQLIQDSGQHEFITFNYAKVTLETTEINAEIVTFTIFPM